MVSLLVLGGSGQVGSAILAECRRRGIAAAGTFRSHALPGLVAWDGGLDAFDALCEELRPSAIVYAAGMSHVDRCETELRECDRANAELPVTLAERCRGGTAFVYFSTDHVFDGRAGPYAEDAAPAPISVYGWSKLTGERGVLAANARALVVRTTGVYGPEPQGKNFVDRLRRVLSRGERVRVPRDQHTTPTYNVDLASWTIEHVASGASGIWHVTGPDVVDRFAFALMAAEAFGLDGSLIEPVATAALGQAAARPLRGGLRTEKLEAGTMRGPRDGLAAHARAVA
jgi:dTDP-4-dehydrorhamnose reductase